MLLGVALRSAAATLACGSLVLLGVPEAGILTLLAGIILLRIVPRHGAARAFESGMVAALAVAGAALVGSWILEAAFGNGFRPGNPLKGVGVVLYVVLPAAVVTGILAVLATEVMGARPKRGPSVAQA